MSVVRTEIPAGCTFNLEITLPSAATEYEQVIIYLYTAKFHVVKFAYIEKTGYGKLTVGSTPNVLTLKLLGNQTVDMCGALMYEILLISDSSEEDENIGNAGIDTTVDIIQHQIRREI